MSTEREAAAHHENASGHSAFWQLQEAKARFSEVVRRAQRDGPQHVSVRGRETVVILSRKDYEQLTGDQPSIVDFILAGEPWPDDLVQAISKRSQEPDREIAF